MKRISSFFGPLLMLLLFGCGGVGTSDERTAEITGNVTDIGGNIVQNAIITCDGRQTTSNTSGAFHLTGIREGVWALRAQSSPSDGIVFSAETSVQTFRDQRTRNMNLTLVRSDQQASIYGVVRDRFGNILQGARVFAIISSGGVQLSSVMDITNANGEYDLRRLAAGFTYIINGSARGFSSDRDSVVLSPGESRRFDITVGDAADPLLTPPQNLTAVAWTSPAIGTVGDSSELRAIEAVKRIHDPRRSSRQDATVFGNPIEVDLYWDLPTSNMQYLLGYGIYRAYTSLGTSIAVDYHRDPESTFFADASDELVENATYYYEITALNVNYPDTGNSESNFSNRVAVSTLGDLFLEPVTFGPTTFHWEPGSGASQYYVYLFDEYPQFGTVEIYRNTAPIGGTSHVYPNTPPLQSGRTYYYMVLGTANGGNSLTISRLGQFVAN